MANDNKFLEYFIERTDKRLESLDEKLDRHQNDLDQKLDKLRTFGWAVALLCISLSPSGEKFLEFIPKLIEMATAIAGGK